jgi:hypothetical protein
MIITKLFENSMIYDKERFFYIDKIILFDVETLRPTQRTPPIICKREDIEIKCFDNEVIVSIKKYNHIIFDGLILKSECYYNGYLCVCWDRAKGFVLFERNRKNQKYLRYVLVLYIYRDFIILFLLIFYYYFIEQKIDYYI